jgi:hypothetical protein
MAISLAMPAHIRPHFDGELIKARDAIQKQDYHAAREALWRAHTLGQAWLVPHARAHLGALQLGLALRAPVEVLSQIFLVLIVVPATVAVRLKAGTSGVSINPRTRRPVPEDLQQLLATA